MPYCNVLAHKRVAIKIEYGRKQQELRIEKRMAAKRPAPTKEAGAAD